MPNEKGALRAVLVPALLAMGAVGLIAFLTSDREQPAEAPARERRAAETPAATAVPPAPAPSDDPGEIPETGVLGAEALGLAAGAVPADAESGDASAITPEVRHHAQLMIPAALVQAIEQGNMAHVRALREQLGARRADRYLSDSDFEAFDLVIDCLEHAPDARDEAKDFLQFGASTILTEPLKRACAE